MKKKITLSKNIALCIVVLMMTAQAFAQVGIGTNSPDASSKLDITATDKGLLIPRVALTATNVAGPVTTPTTSLLVYNTVTAGTAPNQATPGFYYWNGTRWVRFVVGLANDVAWMTTGNSGTTASTSPIGTAVNNNFIGTTDIRDLVFAAGNFERMRIFSSGQVSIGSTALGAKFEVHQTTGTSVARFITYNSANDIELRRTAGTQSSPLATNANSIVGRFLGVGFNGSTWNNVASLSFEAETNVIVGSSPGRVVLNTTPTGTTTPVERTRWLSDGRIGMNTPAPQTTDLLTVTASTTLTYPINGYNAQTTGSALYGSNTNTANPFSALDGDHNGSAGSGVLGTYVGSASGIGVSGATGQYLGSATTGIRIGLRGYSGNANGNQNIGVYGSYNGTAYGIGVYGLGFGGATMTGDFDVAVVGWRANNTNYSGYFNGNQAVANGTKSASVGTSQGNQLLYVTETPAVWFEDIGSAQLVNGKATVNLDPLFLETVFIDANHPMEVFVQVQGECNDVYVIPGTTSFQVIEKQGGSSSVKFSYRIMAKRLHFQDHRFGNDPMWGDGDTRKYNQYAPPPPIDYDANVAFQEKQKKNWKPTPMPEGFEYQFGSKQLSKSDQGTQVNSPQGNPGNSVKSSHKKNKLIKKLQKLTP